MASGLISGVEQAANSKATRQKLTNFFIIGKVKSVNKSGKGGDVICFLPFDIHNIRAGAREGLYRFEHIRYLFEHRRLQALRGVFLWGIQAFFYKIFPLDRGPVKKSLLCHAELAEASLVFRPPVSLTQSRQAAKAGWVSRKNTILAVMPSAVEGSYVSRLPVSLTQSRQAAKVGWVSRKNTILAVMPSAVEGSYVSRLPVSFPPSPSTPFLAKPQKGFAEKAAAFSEKEANFSHLTSVLQFPAAGGREMPGRLRPQGASPKRSGGPSDSESGRDRPLPLLLQRQGTRPK